MSEICEKWPSQFPRAQAEVQLSCYMKEKKSKKYSHLKLVPSNVWLKSDQNSCMFILCQMINWLLDRFFSAVLTILLLITQYKIIKYTLIEEHPYRPPLTQTDRRKWISLIYCSVLFLLTLTCLKMNMSSWLSCQAVTMCMVDSTAPLSTAALILTGSSV